MQFTYFPRVSIKLYMLALLILLLAAQQITPQCQQCGNRRIVQQYRSYPQKKFNFNFEQFFSRFPGFTSPQRQPPSQPRVFNSYGQEAETFGSAIGKSIGRRIQQAMAAQDPAFDIEFAQPSSPASTSSTAYSPPPATSSTTYGSSIPSTYPPSTFAPSAYPTSSSWGSTHPPEDLPTVQQAFQQQQQSYGTVQPQVSLAQSLIGNSNGFGGLPGLLPPPSNGDCPWCSGYRGKRGPDTEKEKKNEKI
ncbi:Intrinsically Disordered Protein, expressed in Pharynx [Caenorhabditis elegans]|uniref:Intrinsically Disordered Protein, expressed in Pharynx n=2 Tax=Caenorhabditis elegans TaxID=6239 RepID=A0A9S6_CAEEL|nr:Intrinsically Disordered Protein, expressed in Pharynx [Caenorhabditis elegans]CCD67329.1 Intrinsically Disordered Protein, expressed in Pharynx [Caenorhabditis elegans]|eukprot:NP_001076600.1 Uncharacterized protein CELE_D1007.13 [Caenorhabditis elegans]